MERQRLDIAFVSDVACPWCAIGLASLDQALARLGDDVEVTIRMEPFELNPDMGPEGAEVVPYLARKYGRTPEQAAAGADMMAERAREAGFPFDYTGDGAPPASMLWNTFEAHKLLRWALAEFGPERQTRLKLALFRAHFQQRRRIGDRAVLLDVAEEAGLDRAGAQAALDDPSLGETVRAEERQAWEMNISGVPAMIFDGKFLVPGAQGPETYADVLRKVVARRG